MIIFIVVHVSVVALSGFSETWGRNPDDGAFGTQEGFVILLMFEKMCIDAYHTCGDANYFSVD